MMQASGCHCIANNAICGLNCVTLNACHGRIFSTKFSTDCFTMKTCVDQWRIHGGGGGDLPSTDAGRPPLAAVVLASQTSMKVCALLYATNGSAIGINLSAGQGL